MSSPNGRHTKLWLALILAAALALRLIGIGWGLPGDVLIGGAYYHPSYMGDETSWVLNIYYSWALERKLYVYAGVHLGHGPGAVYINTAALAAGVATGYLKRPAMDREGFQDSRKFYHRNPEFMRRVYLVPRICAALFGVLAVFLVFRLGCILAGDFAGLLSSAVLAVCPLHVVFSHYARSDGYAAFFAALTFVLACRVYQRGRMTDFVLAGLIAGLSTGVKYPNWLFSVSIIVAYVLRKKDHILPAPRPAQFVWSVVSGIVGFILFVPAAVLEPHSERGFFFWLDENFKQLADPARWTGGQRIDWWMGYGHEGYLKGIFGLVFPSVLTWSLYVLAAIAFVWSCTVFWRRQKIWLIVLVPTALYLLLSFRSILLVERWLTVLMPSLALCVGLFVASVRAPVWRNTLRSIAAFALLHAFLFSLAYDLGMSRPDTRSLAAVWMEEHGAPNTTVGMVKPKLQPTQTRLNWDKFNHAEIFYDPAALETQKPDYFILQWQDVRAFDLYPSSRRDIPEAYEFVRRIREGTEYREVARLSNEARLGPLAFAVGQVSSWDWPFQTVSIYQRIAAH